MLPSESGHSSSETDSKHLHNVLSGTDSSSALPTSPHLWHRGDSDDASRAFEELKHTHALLSEHIGRIQVAERAQHAETIREHQDQLAALVRQVQRGAILSSGTREDAQALRAQLAQVQATHSSIRAEKAVAQQSLDQWRQEQVTAESARRECWAQLCGAQSLLEAADAEARTCEETMHALQHRAAAVQEQLLDARSEGRKRGADLLQAAQGEAGLRAQLAEAGAAGDKLRSSPIAAWQLRGATAEGRTLNGKLEMQRVRELTCLRRHRAVKVEQGRIQAGLKSLGQQRVAALAALRLICGARRTGRAGRQALEDAATIHRLAAETQAAWAEAHQLAKLGSHGRCQGLGPEWDTLSVMGAGLAAGTAALRLLENKRNEMVCRRDAVMAHAASLSTLGAAATAQREALRLQLAQVRAWRDMALRNAEETGTASQALLERIQDSCQAALRMGEQVGNRRQALNEAEARGAQTHAEARRVQADILAAAVAGDAAVHETLTVHKALQAQQDALDMVLTQLHAASQRADREDARTAALRTRLQAQDAWPSQWAAGIRSGAEAAEAAEKWLRHLETIVLHGLERLQRLERHLAALRCLGGNHERGLEVERGKLSRASRDLDEALGQHRTAACQGLQERPWKLPSMQGVRSVGGSSVPAPDLERQAADLEARLTGAEVAGSRLTARLEDVSAKVKALETYQGARSGQQCKAARRPRIDLDAQLRTAKSSLVQAQVARGSLLPWLLVLDVARVSWTERRMCLGYSCEHECQPSCPGSHVLCTQ
ncbi:hypothetical protein ACKKBG_A09350 [Auxenochlorella protothecoides x Auxenochlorella symbiontica]